jgi:hypothetical protein
MMSNKAFDYRTLMQWQVLTNFIALKNIQKKKGVISLNPLEVSRLLQTPLQTLKSLILVYQTFVSFQIPHSVRFFC